MAMQIKRLRESRELSQLELASAIGRTQRWISDRERGSARVTLDDLHLIAEALQVELVLVIGDHRFVGGVRSRATTYEMPPQWELLHMGTNKQIAQRLKAIREELGLSQGDVTERLEQPHTWLSVRERGGVKLSLDDVSEIAGAMGLHAELVIARDRELIELLSTSPAAHLDLVGTLLRVLPTMEEQSRKMLVGMIEVAAEQMSEKPRA
ncbi:MAG: helix-turn-helix transcriptional regulator [Myxococcota bacterium]